MGTLLHQTERKYYYTEDNFEGKLKFIYEKADYHSLTIDQVIRILELVIKENELHALQNDRDRKDEQLAGFGELIMEFNMNFREAFGIDQQEDAPKFLEGIAMAIKGTL